MKGTLHKTDTRWVVRYENKSPKYKRVSYLHPKDVDALKDANLIDPHDFGIPIDFVLIEEMDGITYASIIEKPYLISVEDYVDEQIGLGNIPPEKKDWLISVCNYWKFINK
jgi:hypothetical protein